MMIEDIRPHVRFVNNFGATYAHTQPERVIYDYEFMYILSGVITIFYDGKRYDLKRSDMFFFEPGKRNHMVTYEGVKLKTHCIHFDWYGCPPDDDFRAQDVYFYPITTPELARLTDRLRKRNNPRPENLILPNCIRDLPYESFKPLFAQCFAAYNDRSPSSRLRLRAAFLNIIAELCEIYIDKSGRYADPIHPNIKKSIAYISEHYTENLTVESLSGKYGLTPKYFGSLFKRAVGKSVRAFICDMRINEAKRMLAGTDLKFEEIAERLGFYDAFHFSKSFKEREGVSPKAFRNMMRIEG